ncbi:MAG: flagellar hook-associated protein FlgL [Lachnospiraceae bacterium]
MRITNKMVTDNSLRNMQKAMSKVSNLNEQVTTGKKISAPSEDPVVAIRALKLRTTCDQLTQYKEKNIPDALNWLDTTQTSIQNMYDRLEDVYDLCVQGSTDTFHTDDRQTIINELRALKDALYKEGGTTYAGRYLFSGYKTETNLVFQDEAAKKGLSYKINESVNPSAIEPKRVVLNEIDPTKLDSYLGGGTYNSPVQSSPYVLQLAYDNLNKANETVTVTDKDGNTSTATIPTITIDAVTKDADGNVTSTVSVTPVVMEVADSAKYYDFSDGADAHFIPETGEIVFSDATYNAIKDATSLEISYGKSDFAVGDLRPEMYFDCTCYKEQSDGTTKSVDYTVDEKGQEIQYELSFKQYVTVNAEGKDLITHDMGNRITDMADAVQNVLDIEETISRLKTKLDDPSYANNQTALDQINKMLEDADVELAMKRENMQKLFGNNITNFQNFMNDVSAVQARVGTTVSKVELIQKRVTEQLADFKELKSSNEDIETEEVAIDLYQAELVYDSALSTTATVIKKSLLDYL